MKCFNHPEREAVATCQKCGKGLCRECAEKYTPCMCESCVIQTQRDKQQQAQRKEEERKQKYKNALVDTRSEFIGTSVIGIVVMIAFTFWLGNPFNDPITYHSFIDCMGFFLATFCIPFGWKFITYLQSFFPVTLFGTLWFWFIFIVIKLFLSILIGIPAFIYQLVRTILVQRKINNLK